MRRALFLSAEPFTVRPIRLTALMLAAMVGICLALPVLAQVSGSGLPLPRYVSLRAGEVNLRTGPGVQYPVEWVYRKSGLPLEIIAEYKTWRKVRDWDGAQGWVHQTMLSANRTFIVTGATRVILSKADASARPIARVQAGVVGQLMSCPEASDYCRVQVEGFDGWMFRTDFWGVIKAETF